MGQLPALFSHGVRRHTTRLDLGLLIIITATALATGLFLARWQVSNSSLLIIATAAVLLLPLVVRIASRRFDPFEPIFTFTLAYGVMFVLRPSAVVHTNDFVYTIAEVGVGIDTTFPQTLVLGFLGAVGFVIGHESSWGRRLGRKRSRAAADANLTQVVTIALVLALVGVVLYGLFLALQGASLAVVLAGRSDALRGAIQGSTKYYLFGPLLLIPTALILVAVGMERRQKGLYVLAGIAGGILFLIAGATGSRGSLLPLVGGFVVYFYSTRRKRPSGAAIVVGICVALTVSSFLLATRNTNVREQVGFSGAVSQIVTQPQSIFEPLYRGQDAAEAPALASALTVIPEQVHHTYGRGTLGDVLLRPVPRAIWPGKPPPPREAVIQALWPRAYASRAASPEFSTLLYWYLDGGPIGVFVGLFLLGLLSRAAFESFMSNADLMMPRLLYAVLLLLLVSLLRDSPTDALARAAFVAVPIWLIFRLSRRGLQWPLAR